jgi:hypothetical protein
MNMIPPIKEEGGSYTNFEECPHPDAFTLAFTLMLRILNRFWNGGTPKKCCISEYDPLLEDNT